MGYRPEDLDEATLAYLREVNRTRGSRHNGIFIPGGWLPGAKTFLTAAVICSVFLVWLAYPPADDPNLFVFQALVLALGTLLALLGVKSGRARARFADLDRFEYVDPLHYWEVSSQAVEATSLSEVTSASGQHHFRNGSYTHTSLNLRSKKHGMTITTHDKRLGEVLLGYIRALIFLRTSPEHRDLARNPAALAAVARRATTEGQEGANIKLGPPIQAPWLRGPARSASWVFAAPWVGAAIAAALGFAGFPALDRYIFEEHLFAQVPAQDNGDLGPMEQYLSHFPQGRHAARVTEILDDRTFAQGQRRIHDGRDVSTLRAYVSDARFVRHREEAEAAIEDCVYSVAETDARRDHTPTPLRTYLADARNRRHRDEAQRVISGFYQETTQRLKEIAERRDPKAAFDENIFNAILALVEALATADRPVVTVGFRASEDPLPVTPRQKEIERLVYEARLGEHAELKQIAERASGGTVILGAGATFDRAQALRRQSVIFGRLREAVRRVLAGDILSMEEAKAEERPVMEVAYHTFASGRLYLYTKTEHNLLGMPNTDKETIAGLLRGYEIAWTITIRPPGTEKCFVCEIASAPATSLKLDSKPGDPDWAPCAVILYSAFFDMSTRLIQSFGLEPPAAPTSFTFQEATGR